jgi:osmotically-inducible protein OsmY
MALSKLSRSIAAAFVAALLAGSGVVSGCSSTQTASTQADDALITAKVKSKLAADPEVSAMNLNVSTSEGEVTLTGRVKTENARREAVKLARDTEGVKDVRDLIEVGDLDS